MDAGLKGTAMDRGMWGCPAARVPRGLDVERAWRWCVHRTIRDARLAAARGRSISRPNLERLFARRWARLMEGLPAMDAGRELVLMDLGRLTIRRRYGAMASHANARSR